MASSRFVLHPVLLNKRSRFIFILFLCVAGVLGGIVYWRFSQILLNSGANAYLYSQDLNWYLKVFLSPHFKFSLVLASAALAGGLTAHHVVGPVRRMEQWVKDWEAGRKIGELKVRHGDKFSSLVRMMNEIRQKKTPPAQS